MIGGAETPRRVRARRPQRRGRQTGQILVILAVTLVVILGMVSLAVDGSWGFIQERQDQNAADFATLAVSDSLKSYCINGQAPPTYAQVWDSFQDVVNANAPNVDWSSSPPTLVLTDGSNPPLQTQPVTGPGSGYVPPWACGAQANVATSWNTFLGGLVGQPTLSTVGVAAASAKPTAGSVAAIYSLNESEPHVVLAGGSGNFVVNNGDIYVSTTAQTWGGTASVNGATYYFDDAMDVKQTSSVTVYGTVHSPSTPVSGNTIYPLDTCFEGPAQATVPPPKSQNPQRGNGNYHLACGTEHIDYNHVDTNWNSVGDPLNKPGGTVITDPSTKSSFPGCSSTTYYANPYIGSTVVLQPGIYTVPVTIDTPSGGPGQTIEFADCSGSYEPQTSGSVHYPGIYVFEQGLKINLNNGADQVLGNNIVLATQTALPMPGNVPGNLVGTTFTPTGSGNGAPCLPNGVKGTANNGTPTSEDTGTPCAGTNSRLYQTQTYGGGAPAGGTGMNYSLEFGGVSGSHIIFTPAQSGEWGGILLFQQRTQPGNWGFDAQPGDAANVQLTGLLYNASLPNNGAGASVWWWDPTGIMPGAGGIMQSGYGITSNGSAGWNSSHGNVTVNGIALVENFNTDGYTDITINGSPYNFPNGGLGPGLIG